MMHHELRLRLGIRFVTKWHAMKAERFWTRPISAIYFLGAHLCDFPDSQGFISHFLIFQRFSPNMLLNIRGSYLV